jgi:hypothetical protein
MGLIDQSKIWILLLASIWVLIWKGYSLWLASRIGSKRWFIALLMLNTFGILDIFYIFYIAKKTPKDLARVLGKTKI